MRRRFARYAAYPGQLAAARRRARVWRQAGARRFGPSSRSAKVPCASPQPMVRLLTLLMQGPSTTKQAPQCPP